VFKYLIGERIVHLGKARIFSYLDWTSR